MPAELLPICLRLNASLERLQQAFERERRFTADVSHELRTPIAELRALADVALRGGGNAASTAGYFRDARDIAVQMERMVRGLLALARCHEGTVQVVREPTDISQAIREAWQRNLPTANKKTVAVRLEMPLETVVLTDRTMLQSILGNLFSNAAEYASRGSTVVCKAEIDGGRLRIGELDPEI